MGFCAPDDISNPQDCAVVTFHDAAHLLLLFFVLLRICYVSCGSPGIRKLATTGKLMQLIKIVVALILALLPLIEAVKHVWHGFTHDTKAKANDLAHSTAGLDVIIRTTVWAACFCMLVLSQRHRVKESILSVICWCIILIGSLPWFLKAFHHSPPEHDGDTLRSFAVAMVTFAGYVLLVVCGFVEIIYDTKAAVSGESYEPLLRDGQSANDTAGVTRSATSGAVWKESRRGTQLWEDTEHKNETQFTDLRYTAVSTVDPKQFNYSGYRLRCFSLNYHVKIMICITLQDEPPEALKRTLRGICENVKHLTHMEGAEMWQQVVVTILADGKDAVSEDTLAFVASLGAFDREMLQDADAKGAATALHMFEYSAQITEQESFNMHFPPLQIIFAMKQERSGKLDSHRWFFEALCEQVEPDYCLLTNAGVLPYERAIYKLYFQLETNKNFGAVCGELKSSGGFGKNYVVSAQSFEFKMSYVLDKSFESLCGYITNVPDAFVAYRFKAIREKDGQGPLVEYFRGLVTSLDVESVGRPHMVHYHSPAMVLCFETVARANCGWLVQYVKNAKAVVGVPSEFATYLDQHTRLKTAKMFSLFYNLSRLGHLWQNTSHSLNRKLSLAAQQVYLLLQFILEWFYLAFFYIAFTQLTIEMKAECKSALGDTSHSCWKQVHFKVFNNTYGTERYADITPVPVGLPQCKGPYTSSCANGNCYSCYDFDSLISSHKPKKLTSHEDPDPLDTMCTELGICYKQKATIFSLLSNTNVPPKSTVPNHEPLTFYNESTVMTLWGGVNDCYNPDKYSNEKEKAKQAKLKFECQCDVKKVGGIWTPQLNIPKPFPACCQPAIVEKCGKGTIFNASGAFDMDYSCYETGCPSLHKQSANTIRTLFKSFYAFFVITAFVLGLGNNSADVLYEIKLISVFFGAMFYVMLIVYFNYISTDSLEANIFQIPEKIIQWGSFVLIALVFAAGFLHGELQNLISSWPQYLFVWPSLINVCHVFAFARLDQISPEHMLGVDCYTKQKWAGGADNVSQEKNWKEMRARAAQGTKKFEAERKVFRSLFMMLWLFSNVLCIALVGAMPSSEHKSGSDSVYALLWVVVAFSVVTRFGGSIGYLVMMFMQKRSWFSCGSSNKELRKMTFRADRMAQVEKAKKAQADESKRRRLVFERVEMYLDDVLADEQVQSQALKPAAKAAKDAVDEVRKYLDSSDPQAPFDRNVESSIALSNELQLLSVERRKYLKLAAKLPVSLI
jgi:cellulose synthase/poly-beta-1,6-N-acetylglucosamine synthase-like glycosyltransferase